MTTGLQVSVVMPLYNKAETLRRALRSILRQTMDRFELVVVDDGSTDAGPRIAREFGDPRIRVLSQQNAGVSAARNSGVDAAKADLVAFIDADDEWRPDFLTAVLDLEKRFPECAVYGTAYDVRVGATSRRATLHGLPDAFRSGVMTNYFSVAAQSDPPLWSSAIAVKRHAILAVGGFPVGISAGEDLLTWARLATKYEIAYCTEALATFWKPLDAYHRPGRVPAVPDRVGEELNRLLTEARPKGFEQYLAMWHRMRGATFLQLCDVRQARKELAKALRLRPLSAALSVLLTISLLPGPAARKAYAVLRRMGSS